MAAGISADRSTATESVYIVRGGIAAETITSSLQALLSTRVHPIARHRFTVLDTFDGRVRRAAARLTRSGVNGTSTIAWQPRGTHGQLAIQSKEPVGFAWDLPKGPLQGVLAPVIGVRRLLAQADVERCGSLLEVLDDRDKTVARVRIESGRARLPIAGAEWHALPTVITVTGLRGYGDTYAHLVLLIESRPGVELCPEDLYGLSFQGFDAARGAVLSSARADLAPTVRADVGARQIHLALLPLLTGNEAGLRANLDTEFLHDFRVAVRRTRSLLGQIRHVFPPQATEHFASEFSWIGRLTGPLRDVDVLALSLKGHAEDIPGGDLDALTAFFVDAQQREHDKVVQALDSDRYRRLLTEWQGFLERPPICEPEPRNAARFLAEVVALRARKLTRRIAASAWTVDEHTPAADLHRVRIAAKKLRYLVDATAAFHEPADLERILESLKKLQRVLGDFNDAHVHERQLLECARSIGARGGHEDAARAFGQLAELSRRRGERLREEVVDGLRRFRARDTQSVYRRTFRSAGQAAGAR